MQDSSADSVNRIDVIPIGSVSERGDQTMCLCQQDAGELSDPIPAMVSRCLQVRGKSHSVHNQVDEMTDSNALVSVRLLSSCTMLFNEIALC